MEVESKELGYRRKDLNEPFINPHDLAQCCPLDQHLSITNRESLVSSPIGQLSQLPLEIFHLVLVRLDIQTLTSMRSVNTSLRISIDYVREYNNLVKHSPQLLRALLSTRIASQFSLQIVYDTVSHPACATCGNFGPFIYLLRCIRVCELCVHGDSSYFTLPLGTAGAAFGLTARHLKQVPAFCTLSGRYAHGQIRERGQRWITDVQMVQEKTIEVHGSLERALEVAREKQRRKGTRTPGWNGVTDSLENTSVCVHGIRQRHDKRGGELLRCLPVILVPFPDKNKGALESGISCSQCSALSRVRPPSLHWRRLFTDEGMSAHMEECVK